MNESIGLADAALEWLTTDRVVMLYFVFNTAIQALPDPGPESGLIYRFLFRFAHSLAGNINVVRKRLPRQ